MVRTRFPYFDAHYQSEEKLSVNHHAPARTVLFLLTLISAVVSCQGEDAELSK